MSIKKSQAILKCFIDLKWSVWFTLGSEDKTMHVLWHLRNFFSSTAGQDECENTKWPALLYPPKISKIEKIQLILTVICQ